MHIFIKLPPLGLSFTIRLECLCHVKIVSPQQTIWKLKVFIAVLPLFMPFDPG